jgi:hypothetical protein
VIHPRATKLLERSGVGAEPIKKEDSDVLEVLQLMRIWMADWERTGTHFTSAESRRARAVALGLLRRGRSVEEAFHAGRDALFPQELKPLDPSTAMG